MPHVINIDDGEGVTWLKVYDINPETLQTTLNKMYWHIQGILNETICLIYTEENCTFIFVNCKYFVFILQSYTAQKKINTTLIYSPRNV